MLKYDKSTCIWILLASYNGAHYIEEQIQSIRNQTHGNWKLLIRDDGSTDGTLALIDKFCKLDNRVLLLNDNQDVTGTPQGNFGCLLNYARNADDEGQLFAFSDQDDVWYCDKLAKMISRLNQEDISQPLLAHSDLTVVDSTLEVIATSFLEYQQLKHFDNEQLMSLITQNFVTGCTCVFNRELLVKSTPLPEQVVMHDWWLALCAALYGKVVFEPTSTIAYRQHQENSVGAKGYYQQINPFNGYLLRNLMLSRKNYNRMYCQAKWLHIQASVQLNENDIRYIKLSNFIELCEAKLFQKFCLLKRIKINRSSLGYKFFFYFLVLITRPKILKQ